MANPITWRNVNGPDFSGGNLISSGVSDIQSGLAGLQNILGTQARQEQETWQRVKEANTLNALNQVNQIGSVEQLDSTQASDLINPYGAQVNAQAVMDALKGQRGVIADDMQTEDSITSYTEKVKYGPIASQAALLIQQGRIQEAAPLLQELQGTSYAEKLGSMVQNSDWHNQEVRLKQRGLDLEASRIAAEQKRYTKAEQEDNLANQAAAEVNDLVNKGMPPNDAVSLVARKYGVKPGVNIGKVNNALSVFSTAAYQPSTATQLAIKDLNALKDNVSATGKAHAATILENVAQKLNHNPVMQQEIDNYSTEKNGFAIGDGEGQMSKEDVDAANETLAVKNLPPLSAGEIAWLAQNPNTVAGFTTSYKVDSIISQRVANKGFKEQSSGIQKELNAWQTELAKGTQDKTNLATLHDLSPNAQPGAGNSIEEQTTVLNNALPTLEARIGEIASGPEREQQKEEELKAAKKREEALMGQLAQASTNKGDQQQNSGGQAYSYQTANLPGVNDTPEAKELQANVAKRQWVSNYKPTTPKDWDALKETIAKDIRQDGFMVDVRLGVLDRTFNKAKNGDIKDFRRFFGNSIEKYAEPLYHSQKAGKK